MTRQFKNLQSSDDKGAFFIASLGAITLVFSTACVSTLSSFLLSFLLIIVALILVVIIPPYFP